MPDLSGVVRVHPIANNDGYLLFLYRSKLIAPQIDPFCISCGNSSDLDMALSGNIVEELGQIACV